MDWQDIATAPRDGSASANHRISRDGGHQHIARLTHGGKVSADGGGGEDSEGVAWGAWMAMIAAAAQEGE